MNAQMTRKLTLSKEFLRPLSKTTDGTAPNGMFVDLIVVSDTSGYSCAKIGSCCDAD
jgi:hypothetical protein